MSVWACIESDLRRAMVSAGKGPHEIDATLAALEPVVLAVERAGRHVDLELAWAMLAVEADRQRRRAVHARMRRSA